MKIIIETKDDKYVTGVYADDGENTENDTIIDCAANGFLAITRFCILRDETLTTENKKNVISDLCDEIKKKLLEAIEEEVKELNPSSGSESNGG